MEMSQKKSTTYELCEELFKRCQNRYKDVFEKYETGAILSLDPWSAESNGKVINSGGGLSLVVDGQVLERAACSFSSVGGVMNEKQSSKIFGVEKKTEFRATGVSIIVHPQNPNVPSYHANLRYLETDHASWFGGGCDLTPYYIFDEDIKFFHSQFVKPCEDFKKGAYLEYKENCDQYFYLPHRKERRGVGGIFFDYLNKEKEFSDAQCIHFVEKLSETFPATYDELISRNINKIWTEKQREFQLWRRGRYVEFNLLYDRGTIFGLETGGRVESILSSMPGIVKWKYNYEVEHGSEEERLMKMVRV